ncbi:MAG: hypothetical protein U0Y10_05760 [Spirosomataceae bacterium]
MKRFLLFVGIFFLTHLGFGQKAPRLVRVYLPAWSISLKGGIAQFQGDIRDDVAYKGLGAFFKPSGIHTGFSLRRQFGQVGGISLQTSLASIQDSEHQYYSTQFKTTLWQFQLQGAFDLIHIVYSDVPYGRQRIFLEPSVSYGFSAFRAAAYDLGQTKTLRVTDGFQWRRTYSFGFECRYFLAENQAIGVDFSTSYVNTDILDATVGGASGLLFEGTVHDTTNRKFETAKDHWGYFSFTFTQLIRPTTYRTPQRMQ